MEPKRSICFEADAGFELHRATAAQTNRRDAVLAPLSHSLSIPKDRVLLVASGNDGIVPAVHTEALCEHFGRPEVYWSCGGHILYFDKGRVTERALRFLQDIEVIARNMQIRGYSHPDFRAMREVVKWCVPAHGPGGAAISVYHRGKLVADLACGTRDRQGRPFEPETLALSMSTGKGVMATLLHQMVDRGLVDLEAPVAKYWPEFGKNGKGTITLRQAASHRAGLYSIARVIDSSEEMFDWNHMVHVIEDMWPVHKPDTDFGYHAWTGGWIIGEVLQRVSGKSFPELLKENLADPLGLDGLYMGLPESELPRVAEFLIPSIPRKVLQGRRRGVRAQVRRTASSTARWHSAVGQVVDAMIPPGLGNVLGDPRWLTSVIPSGNGVFNARSLARLYGALSRGGALNGTRLLSAAALAEATEDQNSRIGRVIPFPLRFKVGYMRPVSLGLRLSLGRRQFDLGLPNPHAFGHFGFGGSGAWADPERELGVAIVTNCFGGRIPGDLRPVAVATVSARCAEQRTN